MSVRDTGVDVEDRAEGAPTGVIDLECCGLKVMVRSNSQFALRWLCEFHYRASEDTVDASPGYVVQLIIDPDAFQAMRDTGPRVNGRMDTFLRHGRFERLALWRDDDQSRVLFDDRATSFIRVWKRRRAIDILASEDGARSQGHHHAGRAGIGHFSSASARGCAVARGGGRTRWAGRGDLRGKTSGQDLHAAQRIDPRRGRFRGQ